MAPADLVRQFKKVMGPALHRDRVLSGDAALCRRKFLKYFPEAFHDPTYLSWERGYKWAAHEAWQKDLHQASFRTLLWRKRYAEIAAKAIGIEAKTNLLFSFEKMALREAVKTAAGARMFAEGLYDHLYGPGAAGKKFDAWCETVAALPRTRSKVLTWPVVTVFGFIALPDAHIFLKPNVTRAAATHYGYDFAYDSRPSWKPYADLLAFANIVRKDLHDLKPRDMIDVQSFIWVAGSDEYE